MNSVNVGAKPGISGITPVAAIISKNGVVYNVSIDPDTLEIAIPHSVVTSCGEFTIEWSYTVDGDPAIHRAYETHEVVAPLFTKEQLLASDEKFNVLDDGAVERLESLVRRVIEAHTDVKFGLYNTTTGYVGAASVYTQQPIIQLSPLNEFPVASLIHDDRYGFFFDYYDNSVAPIRSPRETTRIHRNVILNGVFGWTSVPHDVTQAALLLAGDFSCYEDTWKDRYIRAMRAADWRIDYAEGAYVGTGNVKVDHILEKYCYRGMLVI